MGDECNSIAYCLMLQLELKWDEISSPHDLQRLPLNSCGLQSMRRMHVPYPKRGQYFTSRTDPIHDIHQTVSWGSIIGMCIDSHLGKKGSHLSCFIYKSDKRQEASLQVFNNLQGSADSMNEHGDKVTVEGKGYSLAIPILRMSKPKKTGLFYGLDE